MISVAVNPSDADILIGTSYTSYDSLGTSVMGQLTTCVWLRGTVAMNTIYQRQCQSGASGQYVYVYTSGGNDAIPNNERLLHVTEVQVYADVQPRT